MDVAEITKIKVAISDFVTDKVKDEITQSAADKLGAILEARPNPTAPIVVSLIGTASDGLIIKVTTS